VEDLLEPPVRGPRVRDPGAAREVLAAEPLEALVDLAVHARDEERGDRLRVDAPALLAAALEAADERLGDALVGGHREEQRDVDVQPLVDHLLDRGDALLGAGDLDHQVGAIDALPVLARLLHRLLGVEGEVRVDLEGHVAVVARGLVVDAPQHVAAALDVGDRERLVDLARRPALAGELPELVVVVGRAEDRLVEDRRVGRDAAQRVLLDEAAELAALDELAADLVEPDARAGRCEGREALVHLLRGHGYSLSRSTTARPVAATRSGVNPKWLKRSFAGALAPNVVMPITSPSLPAHRCQPSGLSASTHTRARAPGGRILSR
jgi:hypothetical protein